MTEDKEITIQFADGRKATILDVKNVNTKKYIDDLSKKVYELQTENKNLKQTEKEHQELNGRLRQYIKELEEKVEKYRSDWE